ncbi:MAG TPA: FHA domain-containing protein [Burkholderiales bacterium]|jgi:hypothetical protein|nr:FHA domain-containing protein [Burkholderiales bacterium]
MDMSSNATSEHFLVQIERLIDWAPLAPLMHAISTRVHADVPLAALKMSLIARWYGMSEAALLEACHDRISFRRFLGLPATDSHDDVRLAEAFRRNITQASLEAQQLILAVEAQLLAKGFSIKSGAWAEAAVVPVMSSEAVPQNNGSDETALFQPGEMAKLLGQDESLVARGGVQVAKEPLQNTVSAVLEPPAQLDDTPVQCTVEWPWNATTELKDSLNIGREIGFCPVADEIQPYRHVSRRHAELRICSEGVWVCDLRSRNRTFVNDDEVPTGQAYLADTDSRVRFGPNFVILLKLKH